GRTDHGTGGRALTGIDVALVSGAAVVGDRANGRSPRGSAGRTLHSTSLRRLDCGRLGRRSHRVDVRLAAGPEVALVLVLPLLRRVLVLAGIDEQAESGGLGGLLCGGVGRRGGLGADGAGGRPEGESDQRLLHDGLLWRERSQETLPRAATARLWALGPTPHRVTARSGNRRPSAAMLLPDTSHPGPPAAESRGRGVAETKGEGRDAF